MRSRYLLIIMSFLGIALITTGCQREKAGPEEILEKYFSSAMKQDYATAYTCYYTLFRAETSKEEYIKRWKDESVLQSYRITSVKHEGNIARAVVRLTFGPSEKLKRKEPAATTVIIDLIKENGEWKIKV